MTDGYILTDDFIASIELGNKNQQKFSVGNGLHLLVTKKGKYWRYNFRFGDKSQTLALGVYPMVSIKEARIAHKIAWKKVKQV